MLSLLLIPATMIASYMHGAGDMLDGKPKKAWFETKGVAMAVVALAGMIAWFPYGIIFAPAHMFLSRTGKQAQAALDYMDRWSDGTLPRIILSHALPLGIYQCTIAALCGYTGQLVTWGVIAAITVALIGVALLTSYLTRQPEARKDRKESARRGKRAWVEVLGLEGLGAGFQLAAIAYLVGGL